MKLVMVKEIYENGKTLESNINGDNRLNSIVNSTPPPESANFAESLIGHQFPNGWVITEKLQRPGSIGAEDLTGSYFSIGYIATKTEQRSNGSSVVKNAFVKAIDVQKALTVNGGMSLMDRLKLVTNGHTFECSILDVCIKAKLDRVVSIIDKGELTPPAGSMVGVPYIMFELADGDLRKIVSRSSKIDDAWRFRVLHDVAVGIQQLHSQRIAHQDLKPSNVLVFDVEGRGAKIGDLGRASQRGLDVEHDKLVVAGHPSYAPPEQMFGVRPERWEDRREGCDLYHLGTLATFLFSGITPTDHYLESLPLNVRPNPWGGNGSCNYQTALPFLTAEFTVFLEKVSKDFPGWASVEITSMIQNACDPDYGKRGDPAARRKVGSPLGIETFVSRFDRLAKQAAVEARK